MNKIIDLKQIHREKIENMAFEKYGAIKISDDNYMIESNSVCSADNYVPVLNCNLYSDVELIKNIRKMEFKNNDLISVTCKKIKRNNVKVLELIRVTENMSEDSIMELEVKSNLLYEDREALLQIIANENRDKQVFVSFYVNYNFGQLQELVND